MLDNSLAELKRKMEILNSPLDTDKEKEIAVLNNTKVSDNEKTDRHVKHSICHKCKE